MFAVGRCDGWETVMSPAGSRVSSQVAEAWSAPAPETATAAGTADGGLYSQIKEENRHLDFLTTPKTCFEVGEK